MSLRHAAIAGLLGAPAAAGAAVADTFRYALIANDEKVRRLGGDVLGRTTTADSAVSNNGRGPKARRRIEPDARAADMSAIRDVPMTRVGGVTDFPLENSQKPGRETVRAAPPVTTR